jgi:acyl transferase domain-containing protein
VADAISSFDAGDSGLPSAERVSPMRAPVTFMFPGAGAQYVGMARELYQSEPFFKDSIDECCGIVLSQRGLDLTAALLSDNLAALTQPIELLAALFSIEYALAQLWMTWGVRPESMIGHSLGEYVAACISGVFRLDDALRIVAFRGELLETLPEGGMLSIPIGESGAHCYLSADVSLAAVNAPDHCVLSGPVHKLQEVQRELSSRDVETRMLHVTRAGHSSFISPIMDRFAQFVSAFDLARPRVPFISNYSGTWITETEATDPWYWAAHLRNTVRFSQGIEVLLQRPDRLFLEVGPGRTLSTLTRQHKQSSDRLIVSSMRHYRDAQSDVQVLLQAFAQLWMAGAEPDSVAFYSGEHRNRVPLPAYPFERQRHWIDPAPDREGNPQAAVSNALQPHQDEPRNEVEESIIRVWQDVLGIQSVSVGQSFAALGGDARSFQQMQQRLEAEFGLSLSDGSSLTSTISDLVELIAAMGLTIISEEELSSMIESLDLSF